MKREATDFAAPAAELVIAEPLVAASWRNSSQILRICRSRRLPPAGTTPCFGSVRP
jgi:hypothetical protein